MGVWIPRVLPDDEEYVTVSIDTHRQIPRQGTAFGPADQPEDGLAIRIDALDLRVAGRHHPRGIEVGRRQDRRDARRFPGGVGDREIVRLLRPGPEDPSICTQLFGTPPVPMKLS